MTVIERILSNKVGREVHAGERIWVPLDLVTMRDFGGPNAILEYKENFGDASLFDPNKVAITFDLHIPPRNEKVARNQQICREFAKATGARLFDINQGIGQHILWEHGMVQEGDAIIGTDSHMNLLGAFGAFASGVGTTDIVAGMRYGKFWYRVPKTIKIKLRGKLKKFVGAKDVILWVLKNLGTDGAINRAVEFNGDIIEPIGITGRITLASMVTELSGEIGFFESNGEGEYKKVYEFDVSDISPQIACPHSPNNVKDVKNVAGTPIDQVFIGSCTNGRYEDLEQAAKILEGRKVKTRLIVVPASTKVAQEALKHGLYEIFFDVGAVVVNPGCSLCTTGHPGILAPGERMVSTSNRNFIGKLGKGGEIWLASPQTAAASAIRGEITEPGTL
ncbi:homoaconitate hydratase family protein [candidate division WOR-3 bacterium]|nr:homoaconitate hydratase family protein [candidate division WOR-3 bacterium]